MKKLKLKSVNHVVPNVSLVMMNVIVTNVLVSELMPQHVFAQMVGSKTLHLFVNNVPHLV
jgi:hypothetical protein